MSLSKQEIEEAKELIKFLIDDIVKTKYEKMKRENEKDIPTRMISEYVDRKKKAKKAKPKRKCGCK